MTEVGVHTRAVNLARRLSAENEHDLVRKFAIENAMPPHGCLVIVPFFLTPRALGSRSAHAFATWRG